MKAHRVQGCSKPCDTAAAPSTLLRIGLRMTRHPRMGAVEQLQVAVFGCAVSACPNTPHISVPYDPASAYPKYGVPAAGMWHVDAHSGWFAHGQDIQNTH
jgi:hypothetical protein